MDLQNEKLLTQFKFKLQELNQDTAFLDDARFDFFQKFAMYRSVRLGLNLYGINDPNIDADKMDDIVTAQEMDLKTFREKLKIDPRKYNFAQIRELVDAIQTGLDVTPYLNPMYTAEHMHIAKTFQQEGLPGIEQVHPDKSIVELINFRNQSRQLAHKSNQNAKANLQAPSEANHAYEKYFSELEAIANTKKIYLLKYQLEAGEVFIAVDSKDDIKQYLQQEHPSRFDSLKPEEFWETFNSPDVDEMVRQSLYASQDFYDEGSINDYIFALSHYHEVEPPEVYDKQLQKFSQIVIDGNQTLSPTTEQGDDLENSRYGKPHQQDDNFNLAKILDEPVPKEKKLIENIISTCPEAINSRSNEGATPLIVSSYWNRPQEVALLLQYGANANLSSQNGDTALIEAARSNNVEISKMLIEHGADVNYTNHEGTSALSVAARTDNVELAQLLVEHGAIVNAQDITGNTPLHYVPLSSQKFAKYLIEHGADVLKQNQYGNYAEVLFEDNLQEYLSNHLDMPVYLELQGVSCNEYEQITESKPGLTLSQIVTLSREALDSSSFHLEQSKIALAEALIFENVDMDSFNKFEAESSNAMDTLSSVAPVRESVSTSAVEQTEASENQHSFSHS